MEQKKTLGDRAFENAEPKVWNRLSLENRHCQSLSTLKGLLKTHLFKLAFYCFPKIILIIILLYSIISISIYVSNSF